MSVDRLDNWLYSKGDSVVSLSLFDELHECPKLKVLVTQDHGIHMKVIFLRIFQIQRVYSVYFCVFVTHPYAISEQLKIWNLDKNKTNVCLWHLCNRRKKNWRKKSFLCFNCSWSKLFTKTTFRILFGSTLFCFVTDFPLKFCLGENLLLLSGCWNNLLSRFGYFPLLGLWIGNFLFLFQVKISILWSSYHFNDNLYQVFGWCVPDSHTKLSTLLQNLYLESTILATLCNLAQLAVCNGLPSYSDSLQPHCVLYKPTIPAKTEQNIFFRDSECHLVLIGQVLNQCMNCIKKKHTQTKREKYKQIHGATPVQPKAPMSKVSPCRLNATIPVLRDTIKQKEKENEELAEKIRKCINNVNVPADENLANDIHSIMDKYLKDAAVPPFMRLFWNEQVFMLRDNKDVR